MKKVLITMLGAFALLPMMAGNNNVAPWGWATCSDEAGTAYMLNGGNFSDATTATLTALGDGKTDDSQIKQAIAKNDIIIFDGSKGDFTIGETMKISSTKNKTLIGINNARLCTKFFLTDEDNAYLKSQNLEGLSSTDQYTGTLPDGTTLTCDRRAFFTKKAIMELQYQKTGAYSLPNKSGIFHIETSSENIIIRNLSLIGPGAVDIDGADLITNQGKHVWIDHCTFVDSQDGALDSKVCDWATYTYNHFYYTSRSYSHAYTCGCGWVSNHEMVIHMTFACNIWGEGCMRRLPQADDCYIHLVNNYHNCAGNSVGMTINSYSRALVEGNYAASGVKSPLTGSGANRNVTAKDNSFSASSVGEPVSVPYQYTMMPAADVPAALGGEEGAGAKLGNDAENILSTIPTKDRGTKTSSLYYFVDGLVSKNSSGLSTVDFSDGATLVLNNSSKAWSNGTAVTIDGESYTTLKLSNGAENIFTAPEGKDVRSITFYSYINVKEENINFTTYPEYGFRTCYWGKVADQSYTESASDVQILKSRDPKNPDVASFTINPTHVVKFSNKGEQLCFAMKVTYVEQSTGISAPRTIQQPTDHAVYTLQGVRVDKPTKGIYIQNGKKIIIK